MNSTLDQVLNDLDKQSTDLQYISQQLSDLTEKTANLFLSIKVMAEKLAMVSYPNFLSYPEPTKEKIVNDITYYYINLDKKELVKGNKND